MISEGLLKIETALKDNPQVYFPLGRDDRKRENLQLASDIGLGLGMYEDWNTWASTTYHRFVIPNSLDSTGVVVTNTEWMKAIQEGVKDYQVV